jgi:glucose-6-phosphate-specific signal transduction histidine kinase
MEKTAAAIQSSKLSVLERLPTGAWPLISAVYASAWFVLLLPSQGLWFLPAGLRIAALWLTPAKRWVWLFAGEALVGGVLLWRTKDLVLDANFVALSLAPWLVYASVMTLIRRQESGINLSTPRNMLAFLSGCALSAVIVSPILSALFKGDAFVELSFDPNTWSSIFAFAYGDFIGQLIIAPLLIVLLTNNRASLQEPWLWYGVFLAVAFSALVLLLLHYRAELAPFLLLLVFAPMFVVAFRKNWIGAALSITLIGVLLEIYLRYNPLPLAIIITQLAFALFAASSLILGAAMSALRDSLLSLKQQHQNMSAMNSELLTTSEELRQVSQRLVRLEEQGQRELADELDVELGQSLHTLGTHLSFAVRSVKEQETLKILSSIREKTREMEDSLRRVLRQLRPKALDNKGLKDALNNGPLHEVLDDAGIALQTHFVGDLNKLHEDERTAIYRICQSITRQAIGIHGIKTLTFSVQIDDENKADCKVCLDIKMSPLLLEPSSPVSLPLKAVQDRVIALNGHYSVQAIEKSITHRIVFQQKDLLRDGLPA